MRRVRVVSERVRCRAAIGVRAAARGVTLRRSIHRARLRRRVVASGFRGLVRRRGFGRIAARPGRDIERGGMPRGIDVLDHDACSMVRAPQNM
jgi:hypothetical protein